MVSVATTYEENMNRGRRFYNCSAKKTKGITACDNKNISEEKLNKYVNSENYRRALHKYKIMYKSVLEDMVTMLQGKIDEDNNSQVAELKQELEKHKSQQDKLLNSY